MLIAVLALVGMLGIFFLVNGLSAASIQQQRDAATANALAQAKAALIGFAISQTPVSSAGGLPLPDLGSSRNNNIGCTSEGCNAGNFSGNTKNLTVIGRLPWRKLGLPPLRDGYGECLWYAVSGSFQNTQTPDVLNWDSLGHFDVFSSDGTPAGTVSTTGANYDRRPAAIIFSAGPVLPGQDRSTSVTDSVTECGGNYNVRNYLDSLSANAAINNIINYFSGATNNSTGYAYNLTSASNSSLLNATDLSTPKQIVFGSILVGGIQIANDNILAIAADDIFGPLIRRSDFSGLSGQISDMLDSVAFQTHLQAIGIAGNKGTDNVICSNAPDQGFCNNWREMLFLAQLSSTASIIIDGLPTPSICNRVLIFAGRKTTGQVRSTLADKSNAANYLEGANLTAFNIHTAGFNGRSTFDPNSPSADLLRCLP